jgi:alpha-L-rhamnosidase
MPWQHYLRYGDRELLERHYPAFVAWMEHIGRANPDFIRRNAVYNNYGDWLSVGPESDRAVVATAYWVLIADVMAKIAGVLGRRSEAARYRALAARIRAAFCAAFVGADGTIRGDTQTAYLLALDFDVLPVERRGAAAAHLRRRIDEAGGHLQTGFLGVRHLCPVLADIGDVDGAYRLLLNETYPSWGFSIRHGATTIWERWDGWTPERGFQSANMNSFNHYAYGAVGEWIFARVAGIDWDEAAPGFRSIRFRPLFDARIGWCRAGYRGPTGLVESDWRIDGDAVHWAVSVPANCVGTVELPYPAGAIAVDGRGLEGVGASTRFAVESGRTEITVGLT